MSTVNQNIHERILCIHKIICSFPRRESLNILCLRFFCTMFFFSGLLYSLSGAYEFSFICGGKSSECVWTFRSYVLIKCCLSHRNKRVSEYSPTFYFVRISTCVVVRFISYYTLLDYQTNIRKS